MPVEVRKLANLYFAIQHYCTTWVLHLANKSAAACCRAGVQLSISAAHISGASVSQGRNPSSILQTSGELPGRSHIPTRRHSRGHSEEQAGPSSQTRHHVELVHLGDPLQGGSRV